MDVRHTEASVNTAQELFDILKDMRPSEPRKPAPPPPTAAPLVPMYAKLPPKRVELPALGGFCEIVYDWNEGDER